MKYTLKTEHSFDAAHYLKGHDGACRFIHGHRWRVILQVGANTLQKHGSSRDMVIDFTDIKREFRQLIDSFDHSFIIENNEGRFNEQLVSVQIGTLDTVQNTKVIEVPFRPTAENFSKFFYDTMKEKGHPVVSVEVYETPTNSCTYQP